MNGETPMTEERFDELLKEMREESLSAEDMAAAEDRVWRKLTRTACDEFRPQIGDYVAGELAESRRLLVEDHLSRCADCRRVYAELKGERKVIALPAARASKISKYAWMAMAAGVAIGALYISRNQVDRMMAPSGPRATVESVSGSLYRVTGGRLERGAQLGEGDAVRTGTGSRAVLRLLDGSRMEVNARTELAVRASWSGQTVDLERGDVIIEAAKQRRGHLRVVTSDAVAAVKGTVFAVSTGAAGSLVSVVEGSVEVSQAGGDRLVKRGEHTATTQALAKVDVKEAVSWSSDAEKYFALLAELVHIEKQLAAMPGPALRTEAKLLRYLPANAEVYVALPNLGGTIQQALNLVEARAQESAVLRDWWMSASGREIQELARQLQAVTPQLGEEVVFVLTRESGSKAEVPLLMAEVNPGKRADLEQALARLPGEASRVHYRVTDDMLAVSDSADHLAAALSQLGSGAGSPFAADIAARYERGAGWLVGINVGAMRVVPTGSQEAGLLGASSVKYLFFEQRTSGGITDNEATLSFDGPRTGIASWLAAPGSSGSAEYISMDAVFALSASTRNPRQAFDELLASVGTMGNTLSGLRELEAETGISLANDVAAALGTDFTVIVERPTIPVPEFVVAMEVVQPAVLDGALHRIVAAANAKMQSQANPATLTITDETVNGRKWTSLRSSSSPITVQWTYDRGYLLVSTDRAFITRAIAVRDSGSPLVRSARFRDQLPISTGIHQSGFIWFQTQGAMAGLAQFVENNTVKMLLESREPVLIVLDGETERIRAASRTRLTSLMLDLVMVGQAGQGGPSEGRLKRELRAR